MTYLNISRSNQLIFLMEHNFLGLGKMSTTMNRKIYLYKVKDFMV